jgi:excinuclease ABC subunit C
MTSKLEDIPASGRAAASLLKHFGGLVGLKAAGEAEIAKVEGINDALAARIYANLRVGHA